MLNHEDHKGHEEEAQLTVINETMCGKLSVSSVYWFVKRESRGADLG